MTDLVNRLIEETKSGEMEWRQADLPDTFVAASTSGTVTVAARRKPGEQDLYTISVTNQQGEDIEFAVTSSSAEIAERIRRWDVVGLGPATAAAAMQTAAIPGILTLFPGIGWAAGALAGAAVLHQMNRAELKILNESVMLLYKEILKSVGRRSTSG